MRFRQILMHIQALPVLEKTFPASMLAVPIKYGETMLGVMKVINRQDGGSFTEKDLDIAAEIARGLGKGMRTLKNATNDIKHEISKSAEKHGIDTDVTKNINEEVKKVKDDFEDFTGSVSRKL